MAEDHSNERLSFCEKLHRATIGRSHRGSCFSKKNRVLSPSRSPTDRVSAFPLRSDVKPLKNFVYPSKNVEKNGDGGEMSFGEEKYGGYIDGVKMKMRAPSDVGDGGTMVSRCDSFDERVSGFIRRRKFGWVGVSSMGAGSMAPEP